ncbi:DUF3021 family protein [Paenibacillus sp. J22TS3]|uniref:DUF3021 family protein n=1 Tax=Paenibacillus sp. J22TS3 TaxID=2807192 RepID=UPI001B0E8F47|nr:DUF3021 family protein [Paenibacillus sp. J22TS3]GIP22137.1 hypothetical protein J22TS3_24120 [Paenibacillus sp. J22TS3]
MALSNFIKKLVRDFLVIFASIIIIITVLRQIYYPSLAFDLKSIYIIMAFALAGALIGLIMYTPRNISERSIRIRIAVHFCALETILITLASIMGIVDNLQSLIILALEIAFVYGVVHILSWENDKQTAKSINEKLESFKKNLPE